MSLLPYHKGNKTNFINLLFTLTRRRVFTDVFEKSPHPHLHAGDDLHDEKKQGRAAVGKGDEKVRADAYGEQD